MKLVVTSPARLGDLIAELAVGGALRVSTRAQGDPDAGLAALTVVYLDGDVTTSITRACLDHPDAGELFERHAREMRRIDGLLRRGAARVVRVVVAVGSAAAVLGAALDVVTGHSWLHGAVAFLAIGGAGAAAIGLARRFGMKLLVRSARRAMARQTAARAAGPGQRP
jgi:hypothetical protein